LVAEHGGRLHAERLLVGERLRRVGVAGHEERGVGQPVLRDRRRAFLALLGDLARADAGAEALFSDLLPARAGVERADREALLFARVLAADAGAEALLLALRRLALGALGLLLRPLL